MTNWIIIWILVNMLTNTFVILIIIFLQWYIYRHLRHYKHMRHQRHQARYRHLGYQRHLSQHSHMRHQWHHRHLNRHHFISMIACTTVVLEVICLMIHFTRNVKEGLIFIITLQIANAISKKGSQKHLIATTTYIQKNTTR